MKKNKGFTLIELLVVIAIIGILSAVVLASLGNARARARAASAQASMSSIRAQAELGTDAAGTYLADLCTTAGTTAGGLDTLLDAAEANGATGRLCGQNTATAVRPAAWAAQVTLPGGAFYCTDSTGFAGIVAATAITGGVSSADVAC